MDADAELDQLNRSLVGRYEVEKEIGQGGMATVYLARDVRHDRRVAIKVLHPELAAVLGPERFLTEMKVTANLQHPHILSLFDSGTADGQLFYVMPLVEGESLRDRLKKEQQLPIEEAVRIATEVAGALDYAHRHNVVHRDIKPENILLHDGSALVADFGIALAVSNAGGTRLTQTGLSLGTPQYMSPEQATGDKNIDGRTDVYSLGCVLYEMLAGEAPFTGPNSQAIVARVLTEQVRPLRGRRDTVSRALEAAVLKAVQKLPADRFATPLAFAEALRGGGMGSASAGDSIAVRHMLPATGSVRRLLTFITLVLVLIGATVGYLIGKGSRSSAGALPTEWRGELLGGPLAAMSPRVSRDGQYVAFAALVDGQTQVAVLKPQSGAWRVLTSDRTRGVVSDFSWSRDNSKIYYSRFLEVPRGVFSVSPLGTDERLVLEDAAFPDVLPDGSLLVVRINADRVAQIYRFWPESGRVDTLDVLVNSLYGNSYFRAFPDGKEAVFFGRSAAQKDSAAHLYAIDLTSKRIRRLAPDSNFASSTLAVTPDNRWVVINAQVGNLSRIMAVARDGSDRTQTLTSLTSFASGFDIGGDGSLYFDQLVRPGQILRYNPADRRSEVRPIPPRANELVSLLPLPDGRTLFAIPGGGGYRVVSVAPGKDASPFMGTDEETNGPLALLGADRVALMLGSGAKWAVAIASVATGQLVKSLPIHNPASMSGSPDGKTLYYVQSRVVWAIPSDGSGTPTRIRDGDAVAADPHGQYLVVEFDDKTQVRLFHVPLGGGSGSEIMIHSDLHLAPNALSTNAVGPDGRLVVHAVPPASWFWPIAILDPKTGKLDLLPQGTSYDMEGGWSGDGRINYLTWGLESSLWRFRPIAAGGAKP